MARAFLNQDPRRAYYGEAVDSDDDGHWSNRVVVLGRPRVPVPPRSQPEVPTALPILLVFQNRRVEEDDPFETRRFGSIADVAASVRNEPAPTAAARVEDERPTAARATSGSGAAATLPARYRRLLRDPGLSRVVRYGEFKEMLEPQLARSDRLREHHGVSCRVQVYEAAVAQRVEWLAMAVLDRPSDGRQFHPLTEALARKLELMPVFRSRHLVPPHLRQDPGILWPGDRVVQLQLAHDPTVDVEPPRAARETPPASEPARARVAHADSARQATRRRDAIPDNLVRPWEFRLGRDEALYDMDAQACGLTTWLGRLIRWIRGQRDDRKWRALLAGRNADEQLWTVRPPRGWSSRPAVRRWARRTLEEAGYEPEVMLREWEVFWRRKGF